MPPKIELYMADWCPHCRYPKELFKKKGVEYTEINIGEGNDRDELIRRTGGVRSIPQIFINDVHIGDEDELARLEKAGELDALLRD